MLEKYTSAYPDICVKLEGEGPPEPVRLRTTEMVADFGSGFDGTHQRAFLNGEHSNRGSCSANENQ